MGVFSSERKVYVASSLWSLAGDPDKVPRVLPSLVLSSVLGGSKEGLGLSISNGLRSSTFLRSRRFFNWAGDNYEFGMPTGSLGADFSVADHTIGPALRTALALASNEEVEILSARVEELYLGHWAEDWIRRERPLVDLALSLEDGGWDVSFNETTEILTIHLDGETHDMAAPADLLWALEDVTRRLLYVAYRIQTQDSGTDLWEAGDNQLFTYRMGSGNATFDALTPTEEELVEFVPAIPLRLKNTSITEHEHYDNVVTAFRKLTGGKLDDVIEDLEENEDIDDMDFIFVAQGIPLNAKPKACKAYIYAFLKSLMALQPVEANSAIFYETRGKNGKAKANWDSWLAANGSAAPPSSSLVRDTDDARNVLRVMMPGLDDFDMRLRWGAITEQARTGNAARFDGVMRTPLKKGEYWLTMRDDISLEMPDAPGLNETWLRPRSQKRLAVLHQYEKYRYRMLEVTDFEHINMVFKKESVKTSARKALEEEELSGFILPMHIPTLKAMGSVNNAELTGHMSHIIVNSYKVVTTRWYEKGVFKIVLVVVAIAFSVITGGLGSAGLGAAVGLLGTNAAVGAMIGLTGTMAAVVGAVANGIASVILTTMISKASTALLGDKWGAILSQVIALVAFNVTMSFATTGTSGISWASMMRMDKLLELTNAVTGSYSNWVQQDTLGIQEAMVKAGEDYADKSQEIKDQAQEILGSTGVAFDATILTDAAEQFGETSDSFLHRTMMTGSDLIEMSHLLIEGFVDLTLELPGMPP